MELYPLRFGPRQIPMAFLSAQYQFSLLPIATRKLLSSHCLQLQRVSRLFCDGNKSTIMSVYNKIGDGRAANICRYIKYLYIEQIYVEITEWKMNIMEGGDVFQCRRRHVMRLNQKKNSFKRR